MYFNSDQDLYDLYPPCRLKFPFCVAFRLVPSACLISVWSVVVVGAISLCLSLIVCIVHPESTMGFRRFGLRLTDKE